ncbi:UmoD family flagellar biogenesis regulator [Providencia stuartii]|uniref:UmoD family flagellar biogenesis regulator n=1 Tax=Providencia stuartii TaxID=588 RepID=UPI0030F02052
MKLTYKVLLAAIVICLIIIVSITSLRFSKDESRLATVISIEPIKSHRLIEQENCSVMGIFDGFNQEYLSRYHPAQSECKMVFMIEALQKDSLSSLLERDNRKCIATEKVEQIIVGYDVVYRIGNTLGKVRTVYDPGLFIPLDENGRLDLSTSSSQLCKAARNQTDALVPFYCVKLDEASRNSLNMNNAVEIYAGKNTYAYFE